MPTALSCRKSKQKRKRKERLQQLNTRRLESAVLVWLALRDSFKGDKSAQAAEVGKLLAKNAKQAGVDACVFDRAGYLYHGRVKALADGAREGGLQL